MSEQSRHVASLTGAKAVFESEAGSIGQLTAHEFGLLKRLSIKRIELEPGGVREPQWNVNANQLAYVVSGTVLVSTLGNADSFSSFVVPAGQMYHVESGAIYHIENVGDTTAVIVAALRTARPAHFSLQDELQRDDRRRAREHLRPARVGVRRVRPRRLFADLPAHRPRRHPVDRGPAERAAVRHGGPGRTALVSLRQRQARPQAVLGHPRGHLDVPTADPRHGHAQAALASGHGRDGVRRRRARAHASALDPDGSLDTYLLEPGDVYFVPRAYPHHIENVGDGDIDFLIFFDQPTPGDIGYRATASAFSREVLSAAFEVPDRDLPQFPFTPVDPLIVGRVNPGDPIA